MARMRIAVVGSGIAGLSCAWALSQRHDVTLLESDNRLGGHANTVDVRAGGRSHAIDTGFIVSNTWTYPNFSALMDYLDQPMVDTEMTFSVSADKGRYEYSGTHLGHMMGRRRQWLSPSHWGMMADLLRFYRTAEAEAHSIPEHVTLGQYLRLGKYRANFAQRHILPMAAAIWSATPAQMESYPFRAFVRFFSNHKLFDLGRRAPWRTVQGGSRAYVSRLVADSRFEARTGIDIRTIASVGTKLEIEFNSGSACQFDHVVLATPAGQALRLLAQPTRRERDLLGLFATSVNRAYLHRDPALMPQARRFWSAWNYQEQETQGTNGLAVTYWMNALQKLQSPDQHFVSLNPGRKPRPEMVDGVFTYHHPIFTADTLAAQRELWSLQGRRNIWFCGAWFGAGFHEDGLQAGLAVAEQLGGVRRPWKVANESSRIHVAPGTVPVEPFIETAE